MTCTLHAPTSLADLAAILQACGGPDWANLAYLGLLAVLLVVFAIGALLWAVRWVGGR